jgi:hypothetical protein
LRNGDDDETKNINIITLNPEKSNDWKLILDKINTIGTEQRDNAWLDKFNKITFIVL